MSAHNLILTLKTPAATLRKIATGLGLILKGDARKSSVKADWIKQIKEAQALKVPSSLDLILGIVSYRYTNRSVELGAYLIDKFGCSKKYLASKISQMLHRDKQLQIDSHGVLEVSVDGTRLMSQMLREHQIYICVIDGEIAGTLSYSEYNTPPEGGHPYLFKTHDAYKVYVSVSQPKGLTIVGGVCGKLNSIQEEVCKVIENTSNTQIQRAMSFWRKYHHIMNGSMISMAS